MNKRPSTLDHTNAGELSNKESSGKLGKKHGKKFVSSLNAGIPTMRMWNKIKNVTVKYKPRTVPPLEKKRKDDHPA